MTVQPVAVVAGSGLALHDILDEVAETRPFSSLPGLLPCTVSGHEGRFILGQCGGVPVIVQQGRFHLYEGLPFDAATATVDALHQLGARSIIFTNAAGGLLPEMTPGDLMRIERIALWPYRGWTPDPPLILPTFWIAGCASGGTYVWVHGPSYETRAEIEALRRMGYAAVGMSTAPEMARALALGMNTAAISCITNNCTRIQTLTHDHVVDTASRASAALCGILRNAIQRLPGPRFQQN